MNKRIKSNTTIKTLRKWLLVASSNKMLTVKQCRKILAEEANDLTDQEIMEMRDWLTIFAEIIKDTIDFTTLEENNNEHEKTN